MFRNKYSHFVIESKNVIFHGAPGTGKTHLAREVAADIVSDGKTQDFAFLSAEQKEQIKFVQFHPSYDYSDFVEGLRPVLNADGTMGFELRDGVFKTFVKIARENYENSQKSDVDFLKGLNAQEALNEFLSDVKLGEDPFKTNTGNIFHITSFDEQHICIYIPNNPSIKKLSLSIDEIRSTRNSEQ